MYHVCMYIYPIYPTINFSIKKMKHFSHKCLGGKSPPPPGVLFLCRSQHLFGCRRVWPPHLWSWMPLWRRPRKWGSRVRSKSTPMHACLQGLSYFYRHCGLLHYRYCMNFNRSHHYHLKTIAVHYLWSLDFFSSPYTAGISLDQSPG
jgi:hypothetical protein